MKERRERGLNNAKLRRVPFKARWRNAGVVTRPRSTAAPGSAAAADEISAGGDDDDVVDKILKEWGLSSVRKCSEESEKGGAPTGAPNCKCVFLIKP